MIPLMDTAAVLERFDGDREVLEDVVQLFIEEYPKLLKEVRSAIAKQDAVALRHAAHTLKGSVSNFSPEVADVVLELEQLGRNGSVSGAEAMVATMERAIQSLVSEMSAFLLTNAHG